MKYKTLFLIALGVFIILAAISVYPFFTASALNPSGACVNNLRIIDAAKQEWGIENGKTTNDTPTWADLRPYLPNKYSLSRENGSNGIPVCPEGGTYIIGKFGELPRCSIGGLHSLDETEVEKEEKRQDVGQVILVLLLSLDITVMILCGYKLWLSPKK